MRQNLAGAAAFWSLEKPQARKKTGRVGALSDAPGGPCIDCSKNRVFTGVTITAAPISYAVGRPKTASLRRKRLLSVCHILPRPSEARGPWRSCSWAAPRLFAMPHTSPLAWNRPGPDGRKWSEWGKEAMVSMALALKKRGGGFDAAWG